MGDYMCLDLAADGSNSEPDQIELKEGVEVSPLSALFEQGDLVPHILSYLYRPSDIASAARVCKSWSHYMTRALYKEVWVRPWETAPKQKFLGLFDTLKARPELCELVRSLDVRFYPLEIFGEPREGLEQDVALTLMRMINLEKLVWTRDRSTTFDLWSSIFSLQKLVHLEICGRTDLNVFPSVSAELFASMPALRDLRVMMPDQIFCAALSHIIKGLHERPGGGLRGLTLISKACPWFGNDQLEEAAPYLPQLQRLEFLGMTRVSERGLMAIVDAAPDLRELVAEPPPVMPFTQLGNAYLPKLNRLSLSVIRPRGPNTGPKSLVPIPPLPSTSSLRALEFTVTRPDTRYGPNINPEYLENMNSKHIFNKLTRFAFLNMYFNYWALEWLIRSCPDLEELFVNIEDLSASQAIRGTNLRVVHLNRLDGISRNELTQLAMTMPKLEEIGCLNRVYEVHRHWEGESLVTELTRWSQPFTPTYFRVWRP